MPIIGAVEIGRASVLPNVECFISGALSKREPCTPEHWPRVNSLKKFAHGERQRAWQQVPTRFPALKRRVLKVPSEPMHFRSQAALEWQYSELAPHFTGKSYFT
jgi:hypothetical protein